jgi:hypothetical protein
MTEPRASAGIEGRSTPPQAMIGVALLVLDQQN